jgi:hypothetical protein
MRSTGEVLSLASVEARPGVAGQISRILVELSAEFWEPAIAGVDAAASRRASSYVPAAAVHTAGG